MGYSITPGGMDTILAALKRDYRVYAPRRFPKQGSGGGVIRYGEIGSFSEIVYDEKSHFSPKEVLHPVVQTLLYFRDSECVESGVAHEKGLLIFMRACDINGIDRLDTIFLENGGHEDNYYKRLRGRLKIFLLECPQSWRSCFCVSMNANRTDDYDAALRIAGNEVLAEVKSAEFDSYFVSEVQSDYTPTFITANEKRVTVPNLRDRDLVEMITGLEYWNRFDSDCVSCGGCNAVCITCSCFDTVDIVYNETSLDGERRRTWSSCMLEEFSAMAGGHNVRSSAGARMRFKTMHKIFDYRYRFGGEAHMCVGCGRCDDRCPQDIRFSETIGGLSAELEKLPAAEIGRGKR